MTTVTKKITIPPDRHIKLDFYLPDNVALGDAEVRMEIVSVKPPRKPMDLSKWAGCLANSPVFEGDPVEIQRKMRDEWPD